MQILKLGFIFAAIGVFIIACANTETTNTNVADNQIVVTNTTAQPTAAPDALAEARTIYLEACVGCHRENGAGGAAEYEGKKIKVPSYQSKGAMNSSDDRLYDHIANGEEDEMPAFKDKLTETQMRNLVKFIRQEFQKK